MNNLFVLLQAEGQAPQGGSMWSSLIFILLLIVVFWLFFIRPQSKKAKEELGWVAEYDLERMCKDSWRFICKETGREV